MAAAEAYDASGALDGGGSALARALDALLDPSVELPDALADLLTLQCQLTLARSGALLDLSKPQARVVARWPEADGDPDWLGPASRCGHAAREQRSPSLAHLGDVASEAGLAPTTLVVQPVLARGLEHLAVAVEIDSPNAFVVALTQERLELSSRLLAARAKARDAGPGADELGAVVRIASAVGAARDRKEASLALCNQIAAALSAARVSLALGVAGDPRIEAVSHALQFERRSPALRGLEAALRECTARDLETLWPDPECAADEIPATAALAGDDSGRSVCTVPLRLAGEAVGALCVERDAAPLERNDVEVLRLVSELVTARLIELRRADENAIETLRRRAHELQAALRAPRHVARIAAAVVAALAFGSLLFAEGTYRVRAPLVVVADGARIISAPFDGILRAAELQPGDPVAAGSTVIAELETDELELELGRARAEYLRALKEADLARSRGAPGEERVALHSADRARAGMELYRSRIERSRLVSPLGGVLLEGDLRRRIGGPVTRGEVLARVAPLDALRGELAVAEDQIDAILPGQPGRLATAAHPQDRIPVEVVGVDPIAHADGARNAFRVRVRLLDAPQAAASVLPGVRGMAEIEAGQAPYLWMWTRRFVNYLRLHLWI